MNENNKRNLYLKVRVSQEEMDAINRKFQNSGMRSKSDFVRAMIFEGYIVQINENVIQELFKLAGNIASNINQITVRLHRTDNIYANDIAEIEEGVNKLWQALIALLSKISQVKN